jgi:four helix bundle protein
MHRQPLDFERLDVYRCAIESLAIAVRLGERMPRGQADLRDQLRRAGSSIPLNVAKASGKTSRAERAHHHAIARDPALECAAILDVLALLGAISPEGVDRGKRLLERIASLLTKMPR